MLTDHKPLTYNLNSKPDRHSPHQVCQLDFISQFTTDICHITGRGNPVADALSHVEINAAQLGTTPPTVDFQAMAKAQPTDTELQSNYSNLKFTKVSMPMCTTSLLCDLSMGTPRPYVPEQFCRIVFDSLHSLSHPGIRATQHLLTTCFF